MMRKAIFPRLVIALLFVVIPLYGLGLAMNRFGEDRVRTEWMQSMDSRTLFYMNTLENENQHIMNLLAEFINDKDLSHISVLSGIMSRYDWTETVNRIGSKLHLIQSSSVYAKSVSAFMLTIGRTIPDNRSVQDAILDDYEAVRPHAGIDYSHFLVWNGRLFIAKAFPEGVPDPSFVLSVEIDTGELSRTLDNLAESGSGAALIGLNGGWAVTNEDASASDRVAPLRDFVNEQFGGGRLKGNAEIKLNGRDERVSYLYSPSIDAYLCMYIPQTSITGDLSLYRNLVWLLSLISVMIIVAYSYSIFRLIHRPLQKMARAYRRVREGELEPVQLPKGHNEFHYLFVDFNMMIARLRELIHDNYEQKLRAKQAQIKQLQSQINPHFLYNTYYILYRLSQAGDTENVSRFTRHLGKYFEFITYNNDDMITLAEEMRHTKMYVEIQNYRFSERMTVEMEELPDNCRAIMVPKLILQPVVENAYKYALERKRSDGRLHIGVRSLNGLVEISVEDNGDQLSDEEIERLSAELERAGDGTESTGILNVHRRLTLTFGEGCGLKVSRGALGGFKATLTFRGNGAEAAGEDQDEDRSPPTG